MKLTKEIAQEYYIKRDAFYETQEVIHDRIDEVLKLLCTFFNAKLDIWYFPDANEGEIGTMTADLALDEDSIGYIIEGSRITELDDYLCSYGGIPVKFLFMEDADILKVVNEDLEVEKSREKKRKEAAQKRKGMKNDVRKSAMSKLTKEERKALDLK